MGERVLERGSAIAAYAIIIVHTQWTMLALDVLYSQKCSQYVRFLALLRNVHGARSPYPMDYLTCHGRG